MTDIRTVRKHYKFVPTFVAHLERYIFALRYAFKRDCLDIGSKEGFGAHILSYGAHSVTLADINPTYMQRSERYYNYFCPTTTVVCDLEKEFPEGEWDTITAFEVIEHLENTDFVLKNVADHLKPGGTFVFSVPHMVENHEHKVLFDEEKIRSAVSKYLKIEELTVQDSYPLSEEKLYGDLKCYVGVARKVV
jgi:2-polyprenyl-3-methyl-5-hydroxy-6-metoxy-1,4-benzoquinol methylase